MRYKLWPRFETTTVETIHRATPQDFVVLFNILIQHDFAQERRMLRTLSERSVRIAQPNPRLS